MNHETAILSVLFRNPGLPVETILSEVWNMFPNNPPPDRVVLAAFDNLRGAKFAREENRLFFLTESGKKETKRRLKELSDMLHYACWPTAYHRLYG